MSVAMNITKNFHSISESFDISLWYIFVEWNKET